jgi:hypothetical protein
MNGAAYPPQNLTLLQNICWISNYFFFHLVCWVDIEAASFTAWRNRITSTLSRFHSIFSIYNFIYCICKELGPKALDIWTTKRTLSVPVAWSIVSDPDPLWIRNQGGLNCPQKRKKLINFIFYKLSLGLKASPGAWTSFVVFKGTASRDDIKFFFASSVFNVLKSTF